MFYPTPLHMVFSCFYTREHVVVEVLRPRNNNMKFDSIDVEGLCKNKHRQKLLEVQSGIHKAKSNVPTCKFTRIAEYGLDTKATSVTRLSFNSW